MSDKPGWRVAIEEALTKGQEDLLVMPEWIANSIRQWLDATESQPVCLADFVAYVGAVRGVPILAHPNEDEITPEDILAWMPSSVSDAMSDLLADLKGPKL